MASGDGNVYRQQQIWRMIVVCGYGQMRTRHAIGLATVDHISVKAPTTINVDGDEAVPVPGDIEWAEAEGDDLPII